MKGGIPKDFHAGGEGVFSEGIRPGIPTEAGHPFRGKAATDSDVKAATFWPFVGTGGRNHRITQKNYRGKEVIKFIGSSFPLLLLVIFSLNSFFFL